MKMQFTFLIVTGMFDRDQSGQIELQEFQALWTYINQWRTVFEQFDRDRSGAIDATELHNGINIFFVYVCIYVCVYIYIYVCVCM